MDKMLRVLLLLSALPLGTTQQEEKPKYMNCMAGHFREGETALVTCYFGANKNEDDHYYVDWLPLKSEEGGKDVLICFRTSAKKLKCDVLEGYAFDYNITDKLTLKIPWVTKAFAGRYTCQHVPPKGKLTNPCILTVQEFSRPTPIYEESTGRADKISPEESTDTHHETYKIIGVSLVVLFMVLIIVISANFIWRCYLRRQSVIRRDGKAEVQPLDSMSNPIRNDSTQHQKKQEAQLQTTEQDTVQKTSSDTEVCLQTKEESPPPDIINTTEVEETPVITAVQETEKANISHQVQENDPPPDIINKTEVEETPVITAVQETEEANISHQVQENGDDECNANEQTELLK